MAVSCELGDRVGCAPTSASTVLFYDEANRHALTFNMRK